MISASQDKRVLATTARRSGNRLLSIHGRDHRRPQKPSPRGGHRPRRRRRVRPLTNPRVTRALAFRRHARRDGLHGRDAVSEVRPRGSSARLPLSGRCRHELSHESARFIFVRRQRRPGLGLPLRLGTGLPPNPQKAPRSSRPLACPGQTRRRLAGMRRHRTHPRARVGGTGGARMDREEHSTAQPRIRLRALSRFPAHRCRAGCRTAPGPNTAGPAPPASTPARPRRFPNQGSSMRRDAWAI